MIPAKYWSPTKRLMLLGAMAGGKAVEDTATGNPLTFLTDLARPLKSLSIPFTPKQSGSGDPSPSNIRPIVPWDGLTVKHGGKNLLNLNRAEGTPNPTTVLVSPRLMDTEHYYIGLHDANYYFKSYASGTVQNGVIKVTSINNNSYGIGFPVAIKGGSKYTFDCTAEKVLIGVSYYDADWNFVSSGGDIYKSQIPATKTTPDNASYMVIIFRSTVGEEYTYSDIQLFAGQTATAYEPYKPITETDISFPSPVYGGTLDAVTGVLTVEWILRSMKAMRWGNFASYRLFIASESKDKVTLPLCDCFPVVRGNPSVDQTLGAYDNGADYAGAILFCKDGMTSEQDFKDWLNSLEYDPYIAYKVETPQTVTLTPEQIIAIVGNNTLWSDADGEMTAVFFKKG